MKILGLKLVIWGIIFSALAIVISFFALVQSYKANSISEALKQIEVERDKINYEKGEVALLNLVTKYFILNYQRSEFNGSHFRVKTYPPFVANYIEEIGNLALEYDNLTNTTFYLKIYKNYSFIGSIGLFLRKEIMFIKNSIPGKKEYGYDISVWSKMYDTFKVLRNEILSDDAMNDARTIIQSKEIQDIYIYAQNVNKFLNTKNGNQ